MRNPKRRNAALFTALLFFLTHFPAPLIPDARAEVSMGFPAQLAALTVPSGIGKIEDRFKGENGKVAILVQDAHAIPEAQRNIEKLIDYFQKQYGIKTVLVEGAASGLDPQIFRSFPDKKILREVFEKYRENAELTGSTAAAIFNEREGRYHGVEDWPLYEEGLSLYLLAMEGGPELTRELSAYETDLRKKKETAYPRELLEIDALLNSFYADQADLIAVLKKLSAVLEPKKSAELSTLLTEIRQEGMDQSAVEIEVRRMAKKISEHLKADRKEGEEKFRRFNEKYQEFQTSRLSAHAFALFLKEAIFENRLPFEVSKRLSASMERQKTVSQIEGTKLFKDLEAYAADVKESLFQNEEQRELDRETGRVRLLKKLIGLELGSEDWEKLKRDGGQYGHILAENRLDAYRSFYENAEKRDRAFAANMTKLMAGEKAAILISGGFHTRGVSRELKSRGYSCVTVLPQIGSLPEHSLYREHMAGRVSWKDYLRVENGKIDVSQAFIRAARDSLLKHGGRPAAALLKAWRDQILRDLSAKGRAGSASQYLRYLDEPGSPEPPGALLNPGLERVDNFIEGLKSLQRKNEMTQPGVLQLLKAGTILGGFGIPLRHDLLNVEDNGLRYERGRLTAIPLEGNRFQARPEMRADLETVWEALENEPPVVSEGDKYGVRLYFLRHRIHVYLSYPRERRMSIYVSTLEGSVDAYLQGAERAIRPGDGITVEGDADKETLHERVSQLLQTLKADKGVREFLEEREKALAVNEALAKKMQAIKNKYARPVLTNEADRNAALAELSGLFDTQFEDLDERQLDRIQQLLASLGYDPLYPGDRYPLDERPDIPFKRYLSGAAQGDILYIQYLVRSRDSEEEITQEYSGYISKIPVFGGKAILELTHGETVNLNQVFEIIVADGLGGHYKTEEEEGGMSPFYFLTGGHIRRELLQGEIPEDAVVPDGILKGFVNWSGIDTRLPVKIITKKKVSKKEAWSRMRGEKIVVLEVPNEQNNGVFMYKRADGSFGDHDEVDINRAYKLGVDEETAKLKSHQFRIGDRVAVFSGDDYFSGTVENFYAQPFLGRRMAVKIDNPPDPEKAYVHVQFASELEAMSISKKNDISKKLIGGAFEKLHEALYARTVIENELPEQAEDFWRRFAVVYETLFGPEGAFAETGFDPARLDAVFHDVLGKNVEEIYAGLTRPDLGNQEEPLTQLGLLLSRPERDELQSEARKIQIALKLYAGQNVAGNGTVPWTIKESDFEKALSGQPPESDFTVSGLLNLFASTLHSFEDRLRLAFQIAGAREMLRLEEVLGKLWDARERLDSLSPEALEIAAETYTEELVLPDEIQAVRFVLGVKTGGAARSELRGTARAAFNYLLGNNSADPLLLSREITALYDRNGIIRELERLRDIAREDAKLLSGAGASFLSFGAAQFSVEAQNLIERLKKIPGGYSLGFIVPRAAAADEIQSAVKQIAALGFDQVFLQGQDKIGLNDLFKNAGVRVNNSGIQDGAVFLSNQKEAGALVLDRGDMNGIQTASAFVPIIITESGRIENPFIRDYAVVLQAAVALLIAHEGKAALLKDPVPLLEQYGLISSEYQNTVVRSDGSRLFISGIAVKAYLEWKAAGQIEASA